MAKISGTAVQFPIVPHDDQSDQPTHDEKYGKGGWRTVSSISERNAIPAKRRKAWMIVVVDNGDGTKTPYQLDDDLVTWIVYDGDSAIRADLSSNAAGKGADLIALVQGGTVQDAIKHRTPQMLGAVADGIADDTTALQQAATASAGGVLYIPAGTYKQTSPITLPQNIRIVGDGASSIIVCSADIEQLVSSRTSGVTNSQIIIEDIAVVDARTLTTSGSVVRTKMQVRITNGVACECRNVETRCTLEDQTNPVLTNVGGIHFELFGAASAYLNKAINCWVRNGVINMETSDSVIEGGFYWGFPCPYSIRIANSNISLNGVNYIPSPVNGGVYVPDDGSTFLSMVGCFSDGSNVAGVETGPAIFGRLRHATVVGNRFWYSPVEAIHLQFADAVTILGNAFVDNNRNDNGHADILFKPVAASFCRAVTMTGNQHKNSVGNVNKGNVFKEDTSLAANSCYRNVYNHNVSSPNSTGYLSPKISSAGRSFATTSERTVIGPSNTGMETYTSGATAITAGNTSVTVSHNLGITPFAHEINIVPTDANIGTKVWRLGSRTSTTFGIVIDSAAGADIGLSWSVKLEA